MQISVNHIHVLLDVAELMPSSVISFTSNVEGLAYQCARLGKKWAVIACYQARTMEIISDGFVTLETMNT